MEQPRTYAAGERAVALIIHEGSIVLIHRRKAGREYYVLPGGSIERLATQKRTRSPHFFGSTDKLAVVRMTPHVVQLEC